MTSLQMIALYLLGIIFLVALWPVVVQLWECSKAGDCPRIPNLSKEKADG